MSEEQTSYKVTDRRLFNPDGTPREVPEDERPAPEKASAAAAGVNESAPAAPATETPQAASEPTTAQPEQQTPPGDSTTEADQEMELPGADDPASFASFLMSIA